MVAVNFDGLEYCLEKRGFSDNCSPLACERQNKSSPEGIKASPTTVKEETLFIQSREVADGNIEDTQKEGWSLGQ